MHGRDGITAAFVVRGERATALVETGPKSTYDVVVAALDDAGVRELDWIVVTHVHLDHAGAAGTLARRWPRARVAVHSVGAPHLVDPAKLWSSARRIYGDDMERLWGGIDPIEAERVRALDDGDTIDLGGRSLRAVETPGHAYHHHAFLDDATGALFTGDALGVRLPDAGVIRPASPPPEFHLERALGSIERIRKLAPTRLWFTHFGPHDAGAGGSGVDQTCERAGEALRTWAGWVDDARRDGRSVDDVSADVARRARADMEASLAPETVDRLEDTTSYRMNVWGYMRYFDKHAQR